MSDEPKLRSAGEIVRLEPTLARLRTMIDSVEIAIRLKGPIGTDLGQNLTQTANDIAVLIGKHDAYLLAERDVSGEVDVPFKHIPSFDRPPRKKR